MSDSNYLSAPMGVSATAHAQLQDAILKLLSELLLVTSTPPEPRMYMGRRLIYALAELRAYRVPGSLFTALYEIASYDGVTPSGRALVTDVLTIASSDAIFRYVYSLLLGAPSILADNVAFETGHRLITSYVATGKWPFKAIKIFVSTLTFASEWNAISAYVLSAADFRALPSAATAGQVATQ